MSEESLLERAAVVLEDCYRTMHEWQGAAAEPRAAKHAHLLAQEIRAVLSRVHGEAEAGKDEGGTGL